MGATSSDVALETADIILVTDNLEKLQQAICLGRHAQRIVNQNIAFAFFIVFLLVANFAFNLSMPFGVIGHEG